jgi:hypothetical protein
MEAHSGFAAEDSRLRASLNNFIGQREKTYGKSTSGFDRAHQLYLQRKLSVALHSRESIHCEMRSVSSSEPTPKSSMDNCTSESGESTDITVGDLPVQKRRLHDSLPDNNANKTISGQSSPGIAPSLHSL